MKKWSLLLAVWIASIALSSFTIQQERVAGPAEAGTYFVAVNGNDSWSGRLPKPKLTISD
jgi:predicted Rdx family selenoprotein